KIRKTIDVSVTSEQQTTALKMIFGKRDERGRTRHDSKSSATTPVSVAPAAAGAGGISSDAPKKPLSIDRAAD
ncbi:MAG: hypothetical protein ACRD3Q_11910, partial [Terriglobales bacterium]